MGQVYGVEYIVLKQKKINPKSRDDLAYTKRNCTGIGRQFHVRWKKPTDRWKTSRKLEINMNVQLIKTPRFTVLTVGKIILCWTLVTLHFS